MPTPTRTAPLLIVVAFIAATGTAGAQTAALPSTADPSSATASPLADAARRDAAATPLVTAPSRRHQRAPLVGAVIGGVAAAVLTAGLAGAYGNNEGGGFCGACFAQWGAIAIPAGAGIGAGIGFAVRALGSDPRPAPRLPSTPWERSPALRGGRQGVALSVTF